MRFKRQEPFRYQFGQPLACSLRVAGIGGQQKEEEYIAYIHNLSPHGMKLETLQRIPYEHGKTTVEIAFSINNAPLRFFGKIVWEKPFGRTYYYGMRLLVSAEGEEMLIREIKRHAALYRKRK
ncbi:PilZ domain-containing protein [Saccharococcus caldoxylosilyticus]|uniref:PilZ domain-containing protein n=1 Tax=Saccharococcus caldoxylosilyticus TaxID=81408 RepID=UPI00030328B2|nr:PilZ domain-containing protein [Parageobacillus caldoxylosilyticus]